MLNVLKIPSCLKNNVFLHKKEIFCRRHKILNRGKHEEYFTSNYEIMENVIEKFITIGINLPNSKNTLTESALSNLRSSIKKFDSNDNLGTAILHGCGGNFCTGIVDSKEAVELSQKLIKEIHELKKPIIAALDGYTLNFGLQLAIMCDIRVMDKSSVAGFHVKGKKLDFPTFMYERLVMNVGLAKALEIMCSRQTWSASECFDAGLISKITDSGCVLGQSMILAQNITFNTSLENTIEYKSKILSFVSKNS